MPSNYAFPTPFYVRPPITNKERTKVSLLLTIAHEDEETHQLYLLAVTPCSMTWTLHVFSRVVLHGLFCGCCLYLSMLLLSPL